jgi:transcriptional regulator GlxA family with amidase domain
LLDLLNATEDIGFLSPMLQREITYRILRGAGGQRLRAIATAGEQSYRTAKVVEWIRANYARPVRVEDLARIAGMSASTLHHHFRVLTSMSPLQYQKQLRLQAARERMLVRASMQPVRLSPWDTKVQANSIANTAVSSAYPR